MIEIGTGGVLGQIRKNAQDRKFHATLKPRLDAAEEDWSSTQPSSIPAPQIIHHPVDPTLQTGESAKLGGAMEIKSPWDRGHAPPD